LTRSASKLRAACLTLTAALWAIGCGSGGPSPTPIEPPPPPPPPNNPPVVRSITAEHSRLEVKGTTTLTAVVEDTETRTDALKFEWTAATGTITGEGAEVTYEAPQSIEEPEEPEITLTVVETYTVDASERTNRTEFGAKPVRVHDSRAELTKLARTFLDDFIDSSVSASECVRNFADSCSGKLSELRDIEANRRIYNNLPASKYSIRSVTVRQPWNQAEVRASCEFHATSLLTQKTGFSAGTCVLGAKYEADRWWLCTSSFQCEKNCSSLFISVF
jgi:hypothetical protein